jgi:hypothetical protein
MKKRKVHLVIFIVLDQMFRARNLGLCLLVVVVVSIIHCSSRTKRNEKKRNEKTVKGKRYDNKEHDDEKIYEHDSLYLCSFFDESLGGARGARRNIGIEKTAHEPKGSEQKSVSIVSGRNFIVASTRRDRD